MVKAPVQPITKQISRLPYDIDQHVFSKFTNIYFRAHAWAMKKEPIKAPFLSKSNEDEFQDSLAVFKLVSNDTRLTC